MPINRLLKDSKLNPDEVLLLNQAFDRALRLLSLVDRNDPLTEVIARKVIAIGATGLHDPAEIAAMAVKGMK